MSLKCIGNFCREFIVSLAFVSRNVAFTPSSYDVYAGSTFPGLVDSLYELSRAIGSAEEAKKAEICKEQLSVITFFIGNAASTLNEPIKF